MSSYAQSESGGPTRAAVASSSAVRRRGAHPAPCREGQEPRWRARRPSPRALESRRLEGQSACSDASACAACAMLAVRPLVCCRRCGPAVARNASPALVAAADVSNTFMRQNRCSAVSWTDNNGKEAGNLERCAINFMSSRGSKASAPARRASAGGVSGVHTSR